MNNYKFIENHYINSLSNKQLVEMILIEFDLSSIKDKFEESISKLNLSNANAVLKKIEKKLSDKLKEFDVDHEQIKKKSKQSSKEIYSIINNGFKNKIPSKRIAKKVEAKIFKSVSEEIKDSAATGIQIIFSLITAVAIMLFMIGVLIGILNVVLGMNIVLSYIIVLFFTFEIFEISFSLMIKWIGVDSDSTIVSYQNKLKNVSIKKYDESKNEKIYLLHVFIDAFKNVIQKLK